MSVGDSNKMTDAGYIASVIKARQESVEFFSGSHRQERERWVVEEFLGNLGLDFDPAEVVSAPDDPPDVLFRQAKFEVKEILDTGRKRHAEYKQALKQAMTASTAAELLEDATPKDITYTAVCDLVRTEVARFSAKYAPSTKAALDLVFYVNLEDVWGYIDAPLPPIDSWTPYGFRSISVVMGRFGGVLFAANGTADFLVARLGTLIARPREE